MRTLYAILVGGEKKAVKRKLREMIAGINLSAAQKMVETGSEVSEHTSYSIIQTSCPHQPKPGDVMERSISSYVVWKVSEYCCSRHNRYGLGLIMIPDIGHMRGYRSVSVHSDTGFMYGSAIITI